MGIIKSYEPGQFNWIDLNAHSMDAAEEFYGTVFGWTLHAQDTHGGPPYSIFKIDDLSIAGLGQMSDEMKSQKIPSIWNNYINVEDAESTVNQATAAGGYIVMSPMKVLDAGTLAFLADPSGGMFAIWQKENHIGADLVNDPGSLCWNELATRDVQSAKTFYEKVFDWSYEKNLESPNEYYIAFNKGRMNGGIMMMDAQFGEIPAHWSMYIAVKDINEYASKLLEAGGKALHAPIDTAVGPIMVSLDNQGAAFNAIQLTVPPD